MEDKLREHDAESGATGWKECWPTWLFKRLREEVDELEQALVRGTDLLEDGEKVAGEAADVANFTMFICDVLGLLDRRTP